MTLGLGNYHGQAITTGCHSTSYPGECYVKTEILDMKTETWTNGDDYPFARQVTQERSYISLNIFQRTLSSLKIEAAS